MKPHLIGSACHKVQMALDEAMMEGALQLTPELSAHAGRCPRCGPEVQDVELLLGRLRNGAAGVGLGPVPGIVDAVLAQTGTRSLERPSVTLNVAPMEEPKQKASHLQWIAGQVAAVAAVLVISVGLLTYSVLIVNQVVTGTRPSEVVQKLTAPFQDWSLAKFRSAQ